MQRIPSSAVVFLLSFAACDADLDGVDLRSQIDDPCHVGPETPELDVRVLDPDGGWHVAPQVFACSCIDHNTGAWFSVSCTYSPHQACAVCCGKAGGETCGGSSDPTDPDPE